MVAAMKLRGILANSSASRTSTQGQMPLGFERGDKDIKLFVRAGGWGFRYSTTKLGWDLSQENFGPEWIELRLSTPMYISKVEVYETYNPGSM